MKIALVAQPIDRIDPPVKTGSIPIWNYEVALRLADTHDVTVFANHGGSRLRPSTVHHEGVRFRYAPRALGVTERLRESAAKLGRRIRGASGDARKPYYAGASYFLGYSMFVAAEVRRRKFDVVHVHNYSHMVPVIRAMNPDVTLVLHMNCEWLTQLDRKMMAKRVAACHLVFACSDYVGDKIRARFPEHADQCRTVFNGVSMERFRAVPEDKERSGEHPKLLYIGRVSPEKGIHALVQAFKQVLKRFPGAHLDIVGPNRSIVPYEYVVALTDDPNVLALEPYYRDDMTYMEQLEAMLSPEERAQVAFPGNQPQTHLVDFYRDADLFLFPSVWQEPFGMPPVEAMAMYTPTVGTRSGGIVETVQDGVTGLLVEPGDVDGLAVAIIRVLSDEEMRRRMGTAGRQRAETVFSWDRIAERVVEEYIDAA